mgnify:CR=1 FL=1
MRDTTLDYTMQEAAENGFVDKAVIIAGAMTSAGRQTFYGDENNTFNGYKQAEKAGIKNISPTKSIAYGKTTIGNINSE